jgi:hypothetical protein
MTTQQGQPTRTAAKRARAVANSVEANERRRRQPPVINWDEAQVYRLETTHVVNS